MDDSPAPEPKKVKLLLAAAIGATVIFWASSFVGIRYALKEYSPIHLATLRYVIASVFLIFLFPYGTFKKPDLKSIGLVSLSGLLGITLYNICLNIGEQDITAGSASFVVNTVPLFTALFSLLIFKERIRVKNLVALFICFGGVGLISFGERNGLSWGRGFMFVLAAAILQAAYFIIQKIVLNKLNSSETAIYSIWTGTIILLPFSEGLPGAIARSSWSATVSVIYLGIFPAALAYTTWSYAISKIGATRSSVYLFFVPIVSLIISFAWIDEVPGMLSLGGGAIVLTGVVFFNANRLKETRSDFS